MLALPPAFINRPHPATTTKLKSESTGGNAFSISARPVTPFPACILRTFATALRALYGIVCRICRTLINQTGADRWHIFICMGFFMCVHFRAAKDRYLCRCRSASFFRRIRTAQSGQYLARLDFGVNTAPHTAQRFSLSRLLLISAYRTASGAFL